MIEDSQIFVNTIKSGLINSSFLIPTYTFHSEPTLQKGLLYLKNHDIDIVLVDISLPDSKGKETLTNITPKNIKIPIIIISAIDNINIAKQSIEYGFQDFLIKKNLSPSLVARSMLHAIERKELISKIEKNSDKQFSQLIESNADALIVVNTDKSIEFVNKSAEKMMNSPREILVGMPFTFPLNKDKITGITIVHPDKKTIFGEMRTSLIQWEGNDAYLASIRDVTQIKKARDLKTAMKEKEQFNQLKSEFLGAISHELRNPLTIVKGAISNLIEFNEKTFTENQSNLINIAYRNVDRIEKIVKNFLELSRLDSGQMVIDKKQINILSLVHESLEILDNSINEKNIKISVPSSFSTTTYGNPELIVQIFTNLISNGIKYTSTSISIDIEKVKDTIEVRIKDDGHGLSKSVLNGLFKKFVQVNRDSSQRGYQGTGLGLSICQEIVHHHKGSIWVESQIGKGASFIFTLPVYNEKKAYEEFFNNGIKGSTESTPKAFFNIYLNKKPSLTPKNQTLLFQIINDVFKAYNYQVNLFKIKKHLVVHLQGEPRTVFQLRKKLYGGLVKNGFINAPIGISFCPKNGKTINDLADYSKKDSLIKSAYILDEDQETIDILSIFFTKNQWKVSGETSFELALKKMVLLLPNLILLTLKKEDMEHFQKFDAIRSHPMLKHIPIILIAENLSVDDLSSSHLSDKIILEKPVSPEEILKAYKDMTTFKLI